MSATPTATPTPTPAPVVSRPPVPEAPEPPAEMKGTDALAAIETAEYFVEALNHALASGETTTIESLAADECGPCTMLITDIDNLYETGAWQEGGQISVKDATVPDDYAELQQLPVQFYAEQSESASVTADGERRAGAAGRKYVLQVVVEQQQERWMVVDLRDAK
ncbi:DUF6318 family protein [Flavimobilis marinus]|uniref:DUF6318 family protein n=1 Tax=Flavimobilis marinus TaxID=285351 RepID=UPI0015A51CC7|nr:DUF6318 family protein [Flavimobilis marinus]